MKVLQKYIRNFCIIAHIDHGKSTIADRLLEIAGVTNKRSQKAQIMDDMDLERERGITIKSNAISFSYAFNKQHYYFNLIDTPGHSDFSYEVSRSLAACEGCLLVVDATQGIQAQTVANYNHARKANLSIVPVINKVDLNNADYEKIFQTINEMFVYNDGTEILGISAKTGLNCEKIFGKIIDSVPPPQGDLNAPLRGLVFDSYYDSYVGVILKIRIIDGTMQNKERLCVLRNGKQFIANIGYMRLQQKEPSEQLIAGEIGYVITGLKLLADAQVGDTIISIKKPSKIALPDYSPPHPMVFANLYASENTDFQDIHVGLQKLKLNDSALIFERDQSPILGFGFRVGFLGLLHMEIVQERLRREFKLSLIATYPTVEYKITLKNNTIKTISNPSRWPSVTEILNMEEPYVKAQIFCLNIHLGGILQLLQAKRGIQQKIIHIGDNQQIQLIYLLPLAEIVHNFYDPLKSVSEGFASLDYAFDGYRKSLLAKVDILVNGEKIDALSPICHRDQAEKRGRQIVEQLKETIPNQQFQIVLQATIGSKIFARENISALRKNVTAKCYGGDITRKRKLLEKQKSGKKKMRQIGQVKIPHKVFMNMLKNS